MKIMFTIDLENRRAPDADLLQAFIVDAVKRFTHHTQARADVERVRLFADEFDPLQDYREVERKGRVHRRFGGNYARPGKPS
jgi:hypothetical protein